MKGYAHASKLEGVG